MNNRDYKALVATTPYPTDRLVFLRYALRQAARSRGDGVTVARLTEALALPRLPLQDARRPRTFVGAHDKEKTGAVTFASG